MPDCMTLRSDAMVSLVGQVGGVRRCRLGGRKKRAESFWMGMQSSSPPCTRETTSCTSGLSSNYTLDTFEGTIEGAA